MKKLLFLVMCILSYAISLAADTEISIKVTATVGKSFSLYPVKDAGWANKEYISGSESLSDTNAFSIKKTKHTQTYDWYSWSSVTYYDYEITPLQMGIYTLKVYLYSHNDRQEVTASVTITYNITVVDVTAISMPQDLSLYVGDERTLSPIIIQAGAETTLTWLSSNMSVATVSVDGNITAIAQGTTTITCTASNGVSAQCVVTVNPIKATGVTLNYTTYKLLKDETIQLSATISPSNTTNKSVVWSSSNDKVATVGSDGTVTGVSSGNCTITCTTADGSNKSATCAISVPKVNVLTAHDAIGTIGSQSVLSIGLLNEDEIKNLQFDLHLPAGVTVATNANDEMMISLTDRAHSSHAVSPRLLSNGDYRIVVTSLSAKSFSGTEGNIMNITLNVPDDMEAGDYEVKVFSIVLNTKENETIVPADVTSTLKVTDVAPGDASGDGAINVTDVGMVIDHILENTPDNFVESAADVNGDGEVNVTDVGLIIDIILSDEPAGTRKMEEEVGSEMLDPQ